MKMTLHSSSAGNPEQTQDPVESRPYEGLVLPVVLILIFIMAARTPLDSDLWWHLRAGEATWTTGQITLHDLFSSTRIGETWINHSWLSQVGIYLVYHLGGSIALSAVVALLAVASMAFVYYQMEGSPLLRGFILILASVVASFVWSPRPQIASLLLFGVVGYILYMYKWKGRDYLWLLLPVFILWSNLHGGYVLGLLLIGGAIAGETINHLLGYQGREILTWQKILRLAGIGLLSGLAVLINPNGIQTWLIPFQTVGVQALQNLISEWASPDFHQVTQQTMLWLLYLAILAIGMSGRRLDGSDFVLLAGFAYMAFVARRNYGPFAMAAAPVISRHFASAMISWSERVLPRLKRWMEEKGWKRLLDGSNNQRSAAASRIINTSIVGILALLGLIKWIAVSNPVLVEDFEQQSYPKAGVEWIEENQPPGQLLNSYTWGGYLIWNLRDYPVFIDGRTDLYNDQVINEWLQVVNAGSGWQDVLDERKIHLILLEPDYPVVSQLTGEGWRLLYDDEVCVIYGR